MQVLDHARECIGFLRCHEMLRIAIDDRKIETLKLALKQALVLEESGKWPPDAKPLIARGRNLLEVLGALCSFFHRNSCAPPISWPPAPPPPPTEQPRVHAELGDVFVSIALF